MIDNNISASEYDYIFGELRSAPRFIGERLYEGYKSNENNHSNIEVQLNDVQNKKLTYPSRWYY